MNAPDLIARLSAVGIRLARQGDQLVAAPRSALTDEARALIRQHKADLLAAIPDQVPDTSANRTMAESPAVPPLTPAERDRLLALAARWEMDADDIEIMFRQCDHGGEGAGIRFSAAEARRFWFADVDKVCGPQ